MLNCALADAAVTADVRGYWKGPADLRASGLTTWVRDHSGRIRNAPVLAGGCKPFQPSPPPVRRRPCCDVAMLTGLTPRSRKKVVGL